MRSPGTELFIVDNTDEHWKALEYVSQWCDISDSIDIATGFFEIGALLALDGQWQKVDKIRILIGGETTRRTSEAIQRATESLEKSFSEAREADLFLNGIDEIVSAISTGRIEIRVYRKKKFHAKAYITHARNEVVGSAALVGSSNFTKPGLADNIELNIRVLGREVDDLQVWFEEFWSDAEECSKQILTVINRHAVRYSPYEVYAKSLRDLVRGVEPSEHEWESRHSRIYGKLSAYQRQHYHLLKEMGSLWGGGFLTDGVGLGKTLVGLMLAEFYASKGPGGQKNVLILATKTGVDAVWVPELNEYLSHLQGEYGNVLVKSHTFLSQADWEEQVRLLRDRVDVVIIDEGHNFRNPGPIGVDPMRPRSRYRRLKMITEGKLVFHLTATPINNSVVDFLREIELFAPRDDLFAPIGIPSVSTYLNGIENEFIKAERAARKSGEDASKLLDIEEIRRRMASDRLFGELVTQVSRKFAQESAKLEGGEDVLFPETSVPKAIPYDFSKSMAKLLIELGKAFEKTNPLFVLPMYYPLFFAKDPDVDGRAQNRQMQTVALIRTVFLKRFESSTAAFAGSVSDLATKILVWLEKLAPEVRGGEKRLQTWRKLHQDVLDEVRERFRQGIDGDDIDDDLVEPEFEELYDEVDPDVVDLEAMVDAAFDDLDQLKRFLEIIIQGEWQSDEKYDSLRRLLTDPTWGNTGIGGREFVEQKVLVFTEFADTARYIHRRLVDDGVVDVDRLDGSRKGDRLKMIQRFAPFYNKVSEGELAKLKPLRVLVTTDVLAEGVNLQDGTIIVNYDLHWNPVRLIQRIGRVDRRRIPGVEERLLARFPDLKRNRDAIFVRNFLPPKQIENLLRLQSRVSTKAWRISATLGIPSGRLFDEADEFDDVRVFDNFKRQLYGELSPLETLRIKWLQLVADDPGLEDRLSAIPDGVGVSIERDVSDAVLFGCFQFPEPVVVIEESAEVIRWRRTGNSPAWLLRSAKVDTEDLLEIDALISCTPEDLAVTTAEQTRVSGDLSKMRKKKWDEIRKTFDVPLQSDHPRTSSWIEIKEKR